MKFEDALPGFREGKEYVLKSSGVRYILKGNILLGLSSGMWCKSILNLHDLLSVSSFELYKEPPKELTLEEAVKIVGNKGEVYNDVDGKDFNFFMDEHGVFSYMKKGKETYKWNMGVSYFGYTWYEVKS